MSENHNLLGDGTGSGVYSPSTYDKDSNYFQMKPLPGRNGDRLDDTITPKQGLGTLHRGENGLESPYGVNIITSPGQKVFDASPKGSYSIIDSKLRRPDACFFDCKKQLLALLTKGLVRWILTLAIEGGVIWALKFYSKNDVVDGKKKHLFNAMITGLSLCLGLNVASAMKELSTNSRWKLVSKRPHDLHEFDLTLGCGSLINVIRLALMSAKRFPTRRGRLLVCVVWLFLIVAAQIAVAMLGLTYSFERSGSAFILHPGKVTITNLTRFFPTMNASEPVDLAVEQNTAHSYGEVSQSYFAERVTGGLTRKPFLGISASSALFYGQAPDQTDLWQYIFYEQNAEVPASVYSDRSINATTDCKSYPVTSGRNGTSTNITYLYGDTTRDLFVKDVAPGAVTYITETNSTCGRRCAQVWVFQGLQQASDTEPALVLDCNVTVTDVANAYLPEHKLPDNQARIAAGAIGLVGISHGNEGRQYISYPVGSFWTPQPNNPIGSILSLFAIGVIATAGELNPRLNVSGNSPFPGESLTVKWRYAYAVLGSLAVAHLLILFTMSIFATSVVVKDDSELAIARLLRSIVKRIDSSDNMRSKDVSGVKVVYGVKMSQIGEWHLDVAEDISQLDKFPTGWYDAGVSGWLP